MTVTARKYNPGFLSDEELVSSFCVRLDSFESMVESLSECTGSANTHQIVIGPRGSGKTSLLLRVAAEIQRNDDLSSRFFPIVLAEESYEVSTTGEFWLECLSRLAEQAPHKPNTPDLKRSYEELRRVQDDQILGYRCLGTLQDFADRESKRLVLIVENLNMMFRDFVDRDAGWRLRHTLQTEPRIVLLASATSRFDEISNPDYALYHQLSELTLRPLEPEACEVLWQTISGRDRPPETIKALRILTGGNPRLLTILARFGANLSFRELMDDLLDLVDDHTEYFKSHLDALPAQERRVYLALANLWIPATAREIAKQARSDTSKCSAQLARLVERGAVEVTGGSARRKQYYLTERLYNIYYLMRRSRGTAPLVEALIQFMEAYYSPSELKDFAVRTVRESMELDNETKQIHQIAFDRLLDSPFLSVHRDELSTLTSWIHPIPLDDADATNKLFNRAFALTEKGHESDAINLWDDLIRRLKASNAEEDLEIVAASLVSKGIALENLNRSEEAFTTWDEVIRKFGTSTEPKLIDATAAAFTCKAMKLHKRGQLNEALINLDEALNRLEQVGVTQVPLVIANSLYLRGSMLCDLNRLEEALTTWNQILQCYESTNSLMISDVVAASLVSKGDTLAQLNREKEALAVWDDVVRRFGSCDTASVQDSVAWSLVNKGNMLASLNRPQDTLNSMEEVIQRFGSKSMELPSLHFVVYIARMQKAIALVNLKQLPEAVAAYDDVLNHCGAGAPVESIMAVALASVSKGKVLVELNRSEEALTVWNDLVQRFVTSDEPALQYIKKVAQLKIAELHLAMGRGDASVATADRLFDPDSQEFPEINYSGHLTRARAHLLRDNNAACVLEVENALSILSGLGTLKKANIDGLCWLAVELGPAQLRELIVNSQASGLLLPLTTALERELGLESRVAREVEEVAKDIQRDLKERRKRRYNLVPYQ